MLRPTFLHPVPHNKCLWTVPRCNSLSIVQSHLQLLWCLFLIYNLAFGHPQLNHCSQQYKLIFSCVHFVFLKTSHRPTPCLKENRTCLPVFHRFVGCHLHEPGHIQITTTKYLLGIFLLFRNTAPSKKAGNIINFIYSMPFRKIKYHNKTIKYIYK